MKDYRSLEHKIRDMWIAEAEARNTAARKKVENVGRPHDDVKNPETSKLAKQAEIKKKLIDEEQIDEISKELATSYKEKSLYASPSDQEKEKPHQKVNRLVGASRAIRKINADPSIKVPATEEAVYEAANEKNMKQELATSDLADKDAKEIKGGQTQVELQPKTDDRPEEATMEDKKGRKAASKANKEIGAKGSTVKEENMSKFNFGLPPSVMDSVKAILEGRKSKEICPTCGKGPCQCEPVKEEAEQIDEKNWIAGAIKKPGALHKELGVPEGEKIPAKKLNAAAEKGGKLGKRARLAQTLKKMHKEEAEQIDEISRKTVMNYYDKATGSKRGSLKDLKGQSKDAEKNIKRWKTPGHEHWQDAKIGRAHV